MSAATVEKSVTPAAGGGIPLSRLIQVELRKSYDTASGFWLLVSMGVLVTIVFVIMLLVGGLNDTVHLDYGDFTQGAAVPVSFLLPVLGILLVTSEWSQRTALTSFTLVPHRGRVITAKVVAGLIWTVIVVAFSLIAGAFANALNGLIDGGADWHTSGSAILGFAIFMAIGMLTGFAFGALLLNSPGAIVAYFALTLLLPTIFGIGMALVQFFRDVLPWIDFQSAKQPLFTMDFTGEQFGQLLVSGFIWFVLPLVFGTLRILKAEVK